MREEYKNYFVTYSGFQGYAISNVGKGVLPKFLKGHYTTREFAKRQIDAYLDLKAEKHDSTGSGS